MKKVQSFKGKGFVGAILIGLIGFIWGCSPGSPAEDFLKSPLSYVYANGAENQFGGSLTVDDLVTYGINPQAEKSWKRVDEGTWSLIATQSDKITGNTTEVNIVLVRNTSPNRVMLHRLLVNGTEANGMVKDQLANTFGYGALEGKKKAGK